VSGVIGHAGVMWIIMATTVTFMAVSTAMLNVSVYLERKNPENKVLFRGVVFAHDLGPVQDQNRQVRKGMAKTGLVVPAPPRRLLNGIAGP
jgi:hypothetical protein